MGQPILAAAGFQPACPVPDELLGPPVAIPAGHEAKETLRSPVLVLASRLKGGCRHDCLPNCPPQTAKADGGLKGRLQARLPATHPGSLNVSLTGQQRHAVSLAGIVSRHVRPRIQRPVEELLYNSPPSIRKGLPSTINWVASPPLSICGLAETTKHNCTKPRFKLHIGIHRFGAGSIQLSRLALPNAPASRFRTVGSRLSPSNGGWIAFP